MNIENSTINDIEEIFRLYKIATDYQKTKYIVHWPKFDRTLIETELDENRQWKMVIDNTIACIWAITFSDPLIWESRNSNPSIYIHRISTNPDFRGRNLVFKIVEWAKEYGKSKNLDFIRMDTVGENKKLILYYEKCGFDFIGLSKLKNTKGLPEHYNNATVSLFELKL
ncbi:MAG: GNAT family N-acetyltransferase [Proteobacteria bacterium]|nr:GNAT family N-acetyltransferase [Pseudomonadota bacterium]